MLTEAIDPKDFIMGSWPAHELAKRGFQRGTPNGDIYTKPLSAILFLQVAMLREHDGAFDGTRSELVLYTDQGGGHYVMWSGIVAHKYVGPMVDELERLVNDGYKTGFAPLMREFWNKLPKDQPEAQQDPKQFILNQGPFWAFKARLEELRWHYEGVNSVPTMRGNTVDEHQFTKVRDSYHYGSDVSPCSYKAWVSEFVEDGVSLLQTYGSGAKSMASEDARGEQVNVPVEWDIDEIIQLSNMTGAEYAEWVDDEFMANTGPQEAPEPEENVPEPEDDI